MPKTRTRQRTLEYKAIHIEPKTKKQDELLRAIARSQLVVTVGPAGVGKTWCAVQSAVNQLAQNKVKRIVLTRSNIPTGKTLGSFPGDINDKLSPWLAPMTSVIKQRLGVGDYESKLSNGQIQFQPLETIRGASFQNTIILVDEAQNLTYEEVKAITTRIGEGSQMVLMGDPMQKDTRDSGLTEFKYIIQKFKLDVPVVEFTVDDIVRSDLVADLVKAYMKHEDLI
jgi:phosphate starvation-inducible protein PhoH and related proteins